MKQLLALFLLLPGLCFGQGGTLQNLPAPFTVRTYPGKPLSIRFSLGTDSLKTTATAVLRYAPGQRAFPPESQPNVATGPTSFSVSWPAYPAVPGTQYVEVSLGGVVQVTGTIISSFLSATTATVQSLTINHGSVVAINLQVIGGAGGGVSGAAYKTFTLTSAHDGDVIVHGLNTRRVQVEAYQRDSDRYDRVWSDFVIISDTSIQIRGPSGEVCNCDFVITPYKQTSN